MTNVSPRETSGVLPKWESIQSGDLNTLIKPILQQCQAKTRTALEEHMKLVTSQYMTGLARTSREGGIGAAIQIEDLSDISGVNPMTSPDHDTPLRKGPLPDGTPTCGWGLQQMHKTAVDHDFACSLRRVLADGTNTWIVARPLWSV